MAKVNVLCQLKHNNGTDWLMVPSSNQTTLMNDVTIAVNRRNFKHDSLSEKAKANGLPGPVWPRIDGWKLKKYYPENGLPTYRNQKL